MAWIGTLLLAAVIGFAAARWWVAWLLPALGWLALVALAIDENLKDPCELADGCGVGPVLFVALWGLAYAATLGAAAAVGVAARKRWSRRREAAAG